MYTKKIACIAKPESYSCGPRLISFSDGCGGDTPTWVMSVPARSRVRDEGTPQSALEEPGWSSRITVITRRYDPGDWDGYPHSNKFWFNEPSHSENKFAHASFCGSPPPPTFLQRNRRFRNQLPPVFSAIRHPMPPRRQRSNFFLRITETNVHHFFVVASFLVSSSPETSVEESRRFLAGAIVESVPTMLCNSIVAHVPCNVNIFI